MDGLDVNVKFRGGGDGGEKRILRLRPSAFTSALHFVLNYKTNIFYFVVVEHFGNAWKNVLACLKYVAVFFHISVYMTLWYRQWWWKYNLNMPQTVVATPPCTLAAWLASTGRQCGHALSSMKTYRQIHKLKWVHGSLPFISPQ